MILLADGDQTNKDDPSYIPLSRATASVRDRGVEVILAASARPESDTNVRDLRTIASDDKYAWAYNLPHLTTMGPKIVNIFKTYMTGNSTHCT